MDNLNETTRVKRNAQKLPDPDFVYSNTKTSKNATKAKQRQEMRENPEKLFYDLSLQKKDCGVYVRDHCNAKFYTTRLQRWMDSSLEYHKNLWVNTKSILKPVMTAIPGGHQLKIEKAVKGRDDDINLVVD